MKITLALVFTLMSLVSFAQSDVHSISYKEGFKMYGYNDGKRLDSIDATYITFTWWKEGQIAFDYGQYRDSKKELLVKDKQGQILNFESTNLALALNFLYYNGWELIQVVPDISAINTLASRRDTYLLKKRKS